MSAWIAELSAAGAGPDHHRAVKAARALALLADFAVRQGQERRAQLLFSKALSLAPGDAGIGLRLAALHEKYGRYPEVVAALDPWMGATPGEAGSAAAEIRLRWALNQARLDRKRRAVRVLEELTGEAGTQWPHAVAFQELARLRLAANQREPAQRLLVQALRRWPGEPNLTVQLAHVHLLQGNHFESHRLLSELEQAAGQVGPTARDRYNRWPDGPSSQGRRQITAAARVQRPRLSSALRAWRDESAR
jgi:predicted Zn-dependent protease